MKIPLNAHFVVEWTCTECDGNSWVGERGYCSECGKDYSDTLKDPIDWQADTLPCGHPHSCFKVQALYCAECEEGKVTRRITLAELFALISPEGNR